MIPRVLASLLRGRIKRVGIGLLAMVAAAGAVTLDRVQWYLLENHLTPEEQMIWNFNEFQSFVFPPDEGAYRPGVVSE